MKFHFAPYGPGSLIRVQFDDDIVGFADCHPWAYFGDLPLEQQLNLLRQGKMTPLTARSLHFARLDGDARGTGVSLFIGLDIPQSHFLVRDLYQYCASHSLLKIKLGQNLAMEREALQALLKQSDAQVRLDFNCQPSRGEFEEFLQNIERDRIEFYEDPFPYEKSSWEEVQDKYGVAFACDFRSEQAIGHFKAAPYLVVKPAIQDDALFTGPQKIVVTSYIDHPLGQMAAAYTAGQMKKRCNVVSCGLLSNAFNISIPVPPGGSGFGFDELLKKMNWEE